VNCKKLGFTIVELLTVLSIIAMLVGLLIPTLTMVRNTAKETKQTAQLTTIELALTAFKNDYGDYPPSSIVLPSGGRNFNYAGTQKLTEALLGWDLMGFHPRSAWRPDGYDASGLNGTYDPDGNRGDASLYERVGPYLERATAKAFKLNDLFTNAPAEPEGNTFVLCDEFGAKKVSVPSVGGGKATTVKAGTPILYFKADTSKKNIAFGSLDSRIYCAYDNRQIFNLGKMTDPAKAHPLFANSAGGTYPDFYEYIIDPKIFASTNKKWPYRPDSYILITAGADGEYGTDDDICNFGN